MLPAHNRLRNRGEFARTVRRGRRSGGQVLVVHLYEHRPSRDGVLARSGGPRFGLIVSKAVGNAVSRHRVARQLRHICREQCRYLPADVDVVVRALPGAAGVDTERLRRQLNSGLRKLGVDTAGTSPEGGIPL